MLQQIKKHPVIGVILLVLLVFVVLSFAKKLLWLGLLAAVIGIPAVLVFKRGGKKPK